MTNIKVTDKAKVELLDILAKNTQKNIRLFIQGFGWGGPTLGLTLDESKETDEKVRANGVNIIYDKNDEAYLSHSIIDFEKSFYNDGFVVRSSMYGSCWNRITFNST